eukprot:GHVR01178765.1.p1 GENE.GHVR01178765.1~~GHVR01178765.1.p1  ORF type:complete len:123 (-),score=20.68 GHVR01178765.1:6-374(-)
MISTVVRGINRNVKCIMGRPILGGGVASARTIHPLTSSSFSTEEKISASKSETFAFGINAPYMERMYEVWQQDRSKVHASWDAYFTNVTAGMVHDAYQTPPQVACKVGEYFIIYIIIFLLYI